MPSTLQRTLTAASFVLLCVALPASAQETVRIRGTIEKVDGAAYVVKNRDGAEYKVTVSDPGLYVGIVKSTMADITADLPIGIEPILVADQAVTVEGAISEFMTSAL